MAKQIYLSPPHLNGREQQYISEAVTSNWIAPVGPFLDRFEEEISQYLPIKHCLLVQSGTAAIHLALKVLEVGFGDEVMCPSFTFIATVNPILYLGATPILIDSEPESWNMCPDLLKLAIEDRISQGKKPKAVIVVHTYGQAAQMTRILEICDHFEIPLVEDAAEALGSEYKNQKLGTFGKLSIFSFNGNKIITTSTGGALVSNDSSLIEKAKYYATQAKTEKGFYHHAELGYNYRMSNVLAAMGLAQMECLEEKIKSRQEKFTYYKEILGELGSIEFQQDLKDRSSNRWLSCMLINQDQGHSVEGLRLHLAQNKIESRRLWYPLHLQPVIKNCSYYSSHNISVGLFERGLSLPSGSSLTDEDQKTIVDLIKLWYHEIR